MFNPDDGEQSQEADEASQKSCSERVEWNRSTVLRFSRMPDTESRRLVIDFQCIKEMYYLYCCSISKVYIYRLSFMRFSVKYLIN
jgi:hypothetical protein